MSLGDQLKKLQENLSNLPSHVKYKAKPEDVQAVISFYERAWEHFRSHIEDKKEIPPPFKLDYSQSTYAAAVALGISNWSDKTLDNYPGGPTFSTLWKEFNVKGQKNRLKFSWKFNHDGVGIDSWWELHVNPILGPLKR